MYKEGFEIDLWVKVIEEQNEVRFGVALMEKHDLNLRVRSQISNTRLKLFFHF